MTPYKIGAPLYLQAGWAGVIPLPPRKKASPPIGYTGWNGKDPSSKMIETWCNETVGDFQAASNIAIHMPGDVIGIDVDHYDGKTGAQTLTTLYQELGPLPDSYISTSRADGYSGIRWYRVEPGLRWPSGPGKDIEFVHKGHRYAVVWPSIHDKLASSTSGTTTLAKSRNHPSPTTWLGCPTNGRHASQAENSDANKTSHNATPHPKSWPPASPMGRSATQPPKRWRSSITD
jgi:hypothetical protein